MVGHCKSFFKMPIEFKHKFIHNFGIAEKRDNFVAHFLIK